MRPDLVLLDIRLPDGTGFEACRQILKHAPDTRVLILSSIADDATVDEAIRSGANGYLLNEIDGRGLVNAVRDVAAGKSILDPAITARVMRLVKAGGGARRARHPVVPGKSGTRPDRRGLHEQGGRRQTRPERKDREELPQYGVRETSRLAPRRGRGDLRPGKKPLTTGDGGGRAKSS